MHANNHKWLVDLKNEYPESFEFCSVLEVGSQNINGSPREHFDECEYIGTDTVDGKGVDIVVPISGLEKVIEPGRKFDTVVSMNVWEHDPHWEEDLKTIIFFLKPGGLLIQSWGAEGNKFHYPAPWAWVPHARVMKKTIDFGIEVYDNFDEGDRYGGGNGSYDVVGRKIKEE